MPTVEARSSTRSTASASPPESVSPWRWPAKWALGNCCFLPTSWPKTAARASGVESRRIEGLTGVWAGERKIASIGVGIRKWVTYHGFALNVTTDLSWFRRIHLCGLKGREATSIAEEAGNAPTMEAVREAVAAACDRHLEGFA